MEMTLQRFGIGTIRQLAGGAVLPVGILALVAMMVLPLPVFLLDTFFVSVLLRHFLVVLGCRFLLIVLVGLFLMPHCSVLRVISFRLRSGMLRRMLWRQLEPPPSTGRST